MFAPSVWIVRPHGAARAGSAAAPGTQLETSHGSIRCSHDRRRGPASAVVRAAKHFRQYRQLADHRLQGDRYAPSMPWCRWRPPASKPPAACWRNRSRPTPSRARSSPRRVSTNMAINGDGWFVVAKPTSFTDNQPVFSGVSDYTRRGDFQENQGGFLVNGAGYYLMGIPVSAATGNPLGSVPSVLQFSTNFVPAQPTTPNPIPGQSRRAPPPPPSAALTCRAPICSIRSDLPPIRWWERRRRRGSPAPGATLLPDAVAVGTGSVVLATGATTPLVRSASPPARRPPRSP